MLKLSDLAHRADFKLGPVSISPSRRLVEGPGGNASLEPVIMQVFLLLVDAHGEVVTRTQLFDEVWGGTIVGDDSLNRAVGKVRKVLGEVAPDLFEIETIPRTGYRLLGEPIAAPETGAGTGEGAGRVRRRAVIGGGLALAGATAAGLWWSADRDRREFEALMARGEAVLDYGDSTDEAAKYFAQALDIRTDDAKAKGLLAYSLATQVEDRQMGRIVTAVEASESAVRTALETNPNEPNARLAQILLQRSTLDLAANEDRLRAVLADDPRNVQVMRNLWNLLQCAGRSREAFALVERAIALKPVAASNNYPMAQLLWILGRDAEADRVIDRAIQYWPSHRWVRFARFIIFAFTGRQQAARAMLDGRGTAPQHYSPEAIALWRVSLAALQDPSPVRIADARTANLEAAKQKLRLSSQAIMTLSALGEIDAAFEVANALLLFRSPVGSQGSTPNNRPMKSTAWIFAPWLFTPPLAPMRADPRFKALCNGIGLSDYWSTQQVRPDFPIGAV